MVGNLAMSAFEPVRVVVVGVGNFGRLHARTLAGLAEAELVGVVDTDRQAAASLSRDLPNLKQWQRIEDALDQSSAEAFVIATRTESHVDIAEAVLKRGAMVLVEKPLATDLASAQKLAPYVKADSSNFMAGHILLFAPELHRLISEARQRGGLRFINAIRHRPATLGERFRGENPFRLLMVHDLYIACALLESRQPAQILGRLYRNSTANFDLALAELKWSDDLCGSFTASFLTPQGMADEGFDRLEVFGNGWAARLSLNPQPLEIWTDRHQSPICLNIHDDPQAPSGWLAEELRHMCRVVRGVAGVPVGARYQDALQIQNWLETLERSAMGK
jgi:predicted dehydrogenase